MKNIFGVFFLLLSSSLMSMELQLDETKYFLKNLSAPLKLPARANIHIIQSANELYAALAKLPSEKTQNNSLPKANVFKFKPGFYQLNRTISINQDNVYFIGLGKTPFDVVLNGNGMKATQGVDNLIRVTGNKFHVSHLTLQQAGNHLIQYASESGANAPVVQNVVFQDAYEQLLKVSYNKNRLEQYSGSGIVRSSLFRYTKGIGPNWYIGGIDAHGIRDWLIEGNIFVDIASPGKHIAEHAIHLWNNTQNNVVSNNLIIDSDRGIGFGMRNGNKNHDLISNVGGVISSNTLYHRMNGHPFADVAIIVEDSPNVVIRDNLVVSDHQYGNAIEVRFNRSKNVKVTGNKVNKRIVERSGGEALIYDNEKFSSASLIRLMAQSLKLLNQ